jgi:hypothetical protein
MTQNERNFGTKALRRDGAYGGTQGGGLYERAFSETPGLAKLLIFSTATRLLAGLGRLLASGACRCVLQRTNETIPQIRQICTHNAKSVPHGHASVSS